ncbi:hypothetical protein TNCV_926191 [Trichonephila clavipes]|nr:hypothetical protein TNCV_926191 [Trichonephila clavipes]
MYGGSVVQRGHFVTIKDTSCSSLKPSTYHGRIVSKNVFDVTIPFFFLTACRRLLPKHLTGRKLRVIAPLCWVSLAHMDAANLDRQYSRQGQSEMHTQ